MAVDGKIMQRAMARWQQEKQRHADEIQQRKRVLYAKEPRLRQIEAELSTTMSRLIAGALSDGSDPLPAIRVLRDENMDLQRQRAELLAANGYPMDYLEDRPLCDKCGDTGFTKDGVCECLGRYCASEQIRELSKMLDLGTQSFETFDFNWYSGAISSEIGISSREQMEENFDTCQDYAHQFGARSDNLLLSGDPGLGKTFLSACIARVVSQNGYSVVYDTAGHIFSRLEAVKFNREDAESDDDAARYASCDLLIIDDLGTEMTTAFVQSALYQMVNGRLLRGKKTVISTNLNPDELGSRYGRALRSRLEGEYRILPFFGEDIRKLKRQRGL